jgi:hypothetical protein
MSESASMFGIFRSARISVADLHNPDPPQCPDDREAALVMKPGFTFERLSSVTTSQVDALIRAITEQTKAINALAESNQALVQAMIESGEIENGPQDQCL